MKVIAEFDEEGNITPKVLIWEDGRELKITHAHDARRMASTAGGTGYRYSITIDGEERCIWLEDVKFNKVIGGRWFVEIDN